MSAWASHPTTTETMTHDAFRVKHLGKVMTVLGSFVRDTGAKTDVIFCPSTAQASFKAESGAEPTIENTKMADWLKEHVGHPLTHGGGFMSSTGEPGDAMYCQRDHKACFDTKTG